MIIKRIFEGSSFNTMEIKKSGEASSEGMMWWRTKDKRATCHNRVTVSCERHPLNSSRFSKSKWK